ncbi:hypothetical protein ACU8KH_02903 [Lachancea thermotolerans]
MLRVPGPLDFVISAATHYLRTSGATSANANKNATSDFCDPGALAQNSVDDEKWVFCC